MPVKKADMAVNLGNTFGEVGFLQQREGKLVANKTGSNLTLGREWFATIKMNVGAASIGGTEG